MYGNNNKNTSKDKKSIINKYIQSLIYTPPIKKNNHMSIFIKKKSKKV
jgi:hypothetical protein